MQHHIVFGIAQRAENRLLGTRWLRQQGQGLIAVAGKHHLVETFAAHGAMQRHTFAVTLDTCDRARQTNALAERGCQRFHITAGAALNHAPLRAVGDRQQAVILEKAHKELQREAEHVGQRHRPDRRAHGHDVMIDEALAITAGFQVFTQRGVRRDALVFQIIDRLAIETQDIAQHAPEPWRQQIAALGEQAVEVIAVIFHASARIMHRKAHFRRLEADTQLA